jgi:hypothetical protein
MTAGQRLLGLASPRSWVAGLRLPQLFLEALVALSLAFLVWLYARSRHQETLDQVPIPVQVALAPAHAGQYDLEVNGSARVLASFAGPASCMRELREKLQRGAVRVSVTVSVPEERQSESTYRDTVSVEPALVPVPAGVTTSLVEAPCCVPVRLHRLAERRLPVRLDHTGDVPRISQVKLEPTAVLVRGPQDILDRVRSIPTQPYFAPAQSDGTAANESVVRAQVALVRELEGRPILATPDTVSLRYRVQPRQKVFELADVPVRFVQPPDFPWRPHFGTPLAGKVVLRVIGPAGEEPPAVLAFVDLTHGDFAQGRNREPLRVQLPRDFQLAQEPPPLVTFYLEPLAPAATGLPDEHRDEARVRARKRLPTSHEPGSVL